MGVSVTFTDVTRAAGMAIVPAYGLGAVWGDFTWDFLDDFTLEAPKVVRKNLRKILGELPRKGPVLLLRLKRRFVGFGKAKKKAKT